MQTLNYFNNLGAFLFFIGIIFAICFSCTNKLKNAFFDFTCLFWGAAAVILVPVAIIRFLIFYFEN